MSFFRVIKQSVREFLDDDAMTQGAALAFYAVISLAPLLLLIVSIAGILGTDIHERLVEWMSSQVDPQAGNLIERITVNMHAQRQTGIISIIFGAGILLFTVSGLLGHIQHALNIIWNINSESKHWLHEILFKRAISLGILFLAGIVLLASLILSTVIISIAAETIIPLQFINESISVVIYTLLFSIIFHYLPDVRLTWRDVMVGAFITAVLFEAGKYGMSFYFGRSSVGSAYGAAGSLLVLLVWLYYSALIFLLGAEFTEVYTTIYGSGMGKSGGTRK